MTDDRKARFNTPAEAVLIWGNEHSPAHRLDGRPLTEWDRAILEGRDPVAEQVKKMRSD